MMKVPGPENALSGTLIYTATAVSAEWYQPIDPVPVAWGKWRNVAAVELWQAIALSCGIEPTYNPQGADRDFDERMAVAMSHLMPGGTLRAVAIDTARAHCSIVRLADVATLAAACSPPWALPEEFPSPPPAASEPTEKAAALSESSSERRERLTRRRDELKTQRIRAWQKTIAEEEGLSVQRIKQILASGKPKQTAPSWMR